MTCREFEESITALVDNELPDDERRFVERHLTSCSTCQYVYRQERELKRRLFSMAAGVTAPSSLRERILSDAGPVRESPEPAEGWKGLFLPARAVLYPAIVLPLLVLLILPAFYLSLPTKEPISLAALRSHAKIVAGEVSFVRAGNRNELREFLVRSVGGRFAPMKYDLSRAGLEPVGGLVQRIGGRSVLVTVYRGRGIGLTCFTFLGAGEGPPPGSRLFYDRERGMSFYTFSQGSYNGVMHRMGNRNCVIVSRLPLEELLLLARSVPQHNT